MKSTSEVQSSLLTFQKHKAAVHIIKSMILRTSRSKLHSYFVQWCKNIHMSSSRDGAIATGDEFSFYLGGRGDNLLQSNTAVLEAFCGSNNLEDNHQRGMIKINTFSLR